MEIKKYISKKEFEENSDIKPPFNSVPNYDAKIFEFKEFFQDGDFIWNTAGDPDLS